MVLDQKMKGKKCYRQNFLDTVLMGRTRKIIIIKKKTHTIAYATMHKAQTHIHRAFIDDMIELTSKLGKERTDEIMSCGKFW